MQEVTCYKTNGEVMNELFQWDIGQSVVLKNLELDYAPNIHFANRNSKEALVMESTLDNGVITCEIPNCLLEEPYTLIVYGYLSQTDNLEVTSGETTFVSKINVIKRPKPSDYVHEDDPSVISLVNIMKQVRQYAEQVSEDKNDVSKMKSSVEEMVNEFNSTYPQVLDEMQTKADFVDEKYTEALETLNSIPDDYITMQSDLDDLKQKYEALMSMIEAGEITSEEVDALEIIE